MVRIIENQSDILSQNSGGTVDDTSMNNSSRMPDRFAFYYNASYINVRVVYISIENLDQHSWRKRVKSDHCFDGP